MQEFIVTSVCARLTIVEVFDGARFGIRVRIEKKKSIPFKQA